MAEIKSVEQHRIQDLPRFHNMEIPYRGAAHCMCWVLARSFSNQLRNKFWSQISFGVTELGYTGPKSGLKRVVDSIPTQLKDVVSLMNNRTPTVDDHCMSQFCDPRMLVEGCKLVDYSSYAALAAQSQFHDVTRTNDRKWQFVKDGYTQAQS